MVSTKAMLMFGAVAAVALAVPIPESWFSSRVESILFRVVVIVAAALFVWRDTFGLQKPTAEGAAGTEASASASSTQATDTTTADAQQEQCIVNKVKILYASTTGNAKSLALAMRKTINTHTRKSTATASNLKDYEPEDLVKEECIAIVLPTWTGGSPPKVCV